MPTRPMKLRGDVVVPEKPNWDPLERAVARWLPGQFMAMHEVQLTNRVRLCGYKHIITRRYLHIDAELNAYRYGRDNRSHRGFYDPISLDEAFALVLLLPEFEDGWIAHRRFDRPWRVDEEGNEIGPEEDERDFGFITYWEERQAFEAWMRLRQPLEPEALVPGGE